jgi:O-antigen/teichoic acid export membrane protein
LASVTVVGTAEERARVLSVARNSVLVLVPRLVTVGAALATAIVTARYLGPAGKGILSLSMLLVGIGLLFADVGLTRSLTYHVSKGEMGEPHALAVAAYGALALGGAVVVAGLLAEPFVRATLLEGMSYQVYLVSLLSLPAVVFAQLWIVIKMARRQYMAAAIYQLAFAVVSFGVAVTVLIVLAGDIEALVTGNTLVITTLALLLLAGSALRSGLGVRVPRELLGRTARYGLGAYGGSLSNYALLRFDMIVLNAVSGNAVVGQYSVSVTMTESLWHIDNAMGRAAMPDVVSKDEDQAASLVAASGRMMMLVGGTLAAAIFIAAPWLVTFLFGEAFAGAVLPLRILLPGAVCLSVARLVLQYHQGQLGEPGRASLVLGGSAVAALALYLVLVPPFDAVGAAAASTLVYAGTLVVAVVMFGRTSGVPARRVLAPGRADLARLADLISRPRRRDAE